MSYYCTHNSRGDIIGIYNGDGILKAQYKYDSWGNVLSVTDENGNAITSQTHIGNLNPFRYRGYYYDTESGLYYLMSRYYNPVTHRFINADGYFQSGGNILDANMHSYCGNNPIMFSDPTGLCYEAQYTSAGTYIGSYWVVKIAIPGTPGFCNKCKSYGPRNSNNVSYNRSSAQPSNSKPDYFAVNNSAGYADQESHLLFGVGYYTKTANYTYNNYNNAINQITTFTNLDNLALSSLSISNGNTVSTFGLDNISQSYGVTWDDNFYCIEGSFSLADFGAIRLGFNSVNYLGANTFNESGFGIEVNAITLAVLVASAVYFPYALPALA